MEMLMVNSPLPNFIRVYPTILIWLQFPISVFDGPGRIIGLAERLMLAVILLVISFSTIGVVIRANANTPTI
jgi:hypothetical protein